MTEQPKKRGRPAKQPEAELPERAEPASIPFGIYHIVPSDGKFWLYAGPSLLASADTLEEAKELVGK